jgi:hypothetical protein
LLSFLPRLSVSDFLARLADGIPVTLIAVLAIVVTMAWLIGGVGRKQRRLVIGIPWLGLLIGCWGWALYRPMDEPPEHDVLMWITFVVTIASFFLPIVWKRVSVRLATNPNGH